VDKDWKIDNFKSVPLVFPECFLRTEVKIKSSPLRDKFIRGLLEIDIEKRLGSSDKGFGFEKDIKCHPWLESINWDLAEQKKLEPSYKPNVYLINSSLKLSMWILLY
jgi:hypothetical protein